MEGVFYTGSKIDEIEIKELLLRRYNDYHVLMEMELSEFIRFIKFAIEKEQDEKLYFRWCIELPYMEEPCTYNNYKDILTGRNIDKRPEAEIIADIMQAHERMRGGDFGVGNI